MPDEKIIFITREGYNLAGGRIRCYNFSESLNNLGIKSEVLSFADCLGAKSGKKESKLSLIEKIKYNIKAFKILIKAKNAIFIINRFNYHSFAPWIVSLLKGNKVIFDIDDWEIREDPKYYFGFWPSSKAEFLTCFLAKKANLCFGSSVFLTNYLLKYNSNSFKIPSVVKTELFKPSKTNVYNKDTVFSWVGTMHRKDDIENILFIINCFIALHKENKNIKLEIVGDGIYRYLIKEEKFKNKNIYFKKWVHPDEIPYYIKTVDIGLVALIQDTKFNKAKSPVKMFEFMASGKPVVAGYYGEMNNIITNGEEGFIAKNKSEFIKYMKKLSNNSSLRFKMGQKARKTACRQYSLDKIKYNIKTNINKII